MMVSVTTLANVEKSTEAVTNSGSKSFSNAIIEASTAEGIADWMRPILRSSPLTPSSR